MHLLVLPLVFVGLTSKIMNKKISSLYDYDKDQYEIDYIFATMVNGIKLNSNIKKDTDESNRI
jgi:hypothetical protein